MIYTNDTCSFFCRSICCEVKGKVSGSGGGRTRWSENNLKLQRTHVAHSGHLPMRSFNTGTLLFPEKQRAFFSQRELRVLCACLAAAFRFRSPCRVFTKGPRNSINLRGRAAEFGSAQPLSSASGIRCHLAKAASNYIFLSRLLYPR